jgi:predicted permease
VRALPGVEAASLVRVVPLTGRRTTSLWVEGRQPDSPGEELEITTNVVGLDYFRTMGIALAAGRDFSPGDVEEAPSVVVANESFAAQYFPAGDALGKRVRLNRADEGWREIVGIVEDSKYRTLGERATPFLYQPLGQQHETGMSLLVRTRGSPEPFAGDVRRAILSLEPNLPVAVEPLSSLVSDSLFPARMGARLLVTFAALAAFLAAVGLYGVTSFAVSRRTKEMGIRLALGARPRALLRLVLEEGLLLVALGISIGWAGALAATRLLSSFLYGVSPTDVPTFLAVALLLSLVMLATTYFPARRAASADPLKALRYE